MRSVASRRPLDKIVDDILKALKPLQPETVRPALMEVARNTQFMGPRLRKIASLPRLRSEPKRLCAHQTPWWKCTAISTMTSSFITCARPLNCSRDSQRRRIQTPTFGSGHW